MGAKSDNPMPEQNRRKIHDRILGMRFMPGKKKMNCAAMAEAINDLWPGVTRWQVRAVVAALASTEARIRATPSRFAPARLESG